MEIDFDKDELPRILDTFLTQKLQEISAKLPTLVHEDAASFACGYNTGYKIALIDLLHHLKLSLRNKNNKGYDAKDYYDF